MAKGLANAEIAERLCVSQTTVKARIDHLFTKAGRRDRAQAVNYADRTEIAHPPFTPTHYRNAASAGARLGSLDTLGLGGAARAHDERMKALASRPSSGGRPARGASQTACRAPRACGRGGSPLVAASGSAARSGR